MLVSGLLPIAIILLVVITALVHLDRAITMGFFTGHAGGPPVTGGHLGGNGGGIHPGGNGGGIHPGGNGGGIHPGGNVSGGPSGPMILIFQNLPLLFILNFIGYIVLVVALYLPPLKRFQRIIRWLLIAFTAITIIAYFVVMGLSTNPLGYVDKIIELALIVLLVIEDRKTAQLART